MFCETESCNFPNMPPPSPASTFTRTDAEFRLIKCHASGHKLMTTEIRKESFPYVQHYIVVVRSSAGVNQCSYPDFRRLCCFTLAKDLYYYYYFYYYQAAISKLYWFTYHHLKKYYEINWWIIKLIRPILRIYEALHKLPEGGYWGMGEGKAGAPEGGYWGNMAPA